MPESDSELQSFLERMRAVLKSPQHVRFEPRNKNLTTLARLNMTARDVMRKLAALGPDQYSKGPEADDNGSDGSIWVFFHDEEGERIYVKLKLYEVDGVDWLKILSFHD